MIPTHETTQAAERAIVEMLSQGQLVLGIESALNACRAADQRMDGLLATIAELKDAVEQRDGALREWESAFAPNRPLGVRFPPMGPTS